MKRNISRKHYYPTGIIPFNSKKDKVYRKIFTITSLRRLLVKILSGNLRKYIPGKVVKRFEYVLFYYQDAPIRGMGRYPNVPKNLEFRELEYGIESRPATFLKDHEPCRFEMDVGSAKTLWTGMCLLWQQDKKKRRIIRGCDVFLNIKLTSPQCEETKCLRLPVSPKKHGIAFFNEGGNWFDLGIDVSNHQSSTVKVEIETHYDSSTLLMMSDTPPKSPVQLNTTIVGLSTPQLFKPKLKKPRKILFLGCESMTDPFVVARTHPHILEGIPAFRELVADSEHFKFSYSAVDSTLPYSATIMSGLTPSQHSVGDYTIDCSRYWANPELETMSSLLKKDGFISAAGVVSPRISSKYGRSKGFDVYRGSTSPHANDVPESDWIIQCFESFREADLFVFSHLHKLHAPYLNNSDFESMKLHKVNSLDAANRRDFKEVFVDQYKAQDLHIANIVSYLKRTGQYEDTMIVLIGDHGASISPEWKGYYSVEYAHYEFHQRVPLVVKHASWSDRKVEPCKQDAPVSATFKAFSEIIRAAGMELPEYMRDLPQHEHSGIAVTETIYHPDLDNFAMSFVDEKYKFWSNFRCNWSDLSKNPKVLEERLYAVDVKNNFVDEEQNLVGQLDVAESYRRRLAAIVRKNFDFRSKYDVNSFPGNMNKF